MAFKKSKVPKAPQFKELAGLDSAEFQEFDKVVKAKGTQKVYRDLKYDEQVKFCLLIKKFLILAPGWTLTKAEEGGEEEYDFVINNLGSLRKSFNNILFQILSAFEYGFSCSEELWKKEDGKIMLDDIKVKFPWDVEFAYDEFGNLNELKISDSKCPIYKFVIYSFMEQFDNKSGESDLKACYSAWWFKSNIWKFWSRHLERFGSPIVKGHTPAGTSEEENSKFYVVLNRLHHIVGMILPRSRTGEEFDFELVESSREGAQQFVSAMENADARIARSLLIPQLFGASKSNFGSYALGGLQFKVVYQFLSFLATTIADEVVQRQIIKRLVDYNFNEPKYPTFSFNPFAEDIVEKAIEEVIEESKGGNSQKIFKLKEKNISRCPVCKGEIVGISKDRRTFTCQNGHSLRRV